MNVFVVYESMFGNTAEVARAIARGAAASRCAEVHDIASVEVEGADLLIIGGPTHALSMSRPSTRHGAVEQGSEPSLEDVGLREWLAALPVHVTAPVATFDTRV